MIQFNVPETVSCRQKRLSGAQTEKQSRFPSLVQVLVFERYFQNDKRFTLKGAGTLIVSNWVLTAAQCLHGIEEADDIRISVDPHSNLESAGSLLEVESYHPHENYNHRSKQSDIALIRVSEPEIEMKILKCDLKRSL